MINTQLRKVKDKNYCFRKIRLLGSGRREIRGKKMGLGIGRKLWSRRKINY